MARIQSGPYHKDRVAGPGQVGFFKFVAVPMYEAFAEVFQDAGQPLLHFCRANMQAWADMGEVEKRGAERAADAEAEAAAEAEAIRSGVPRASRVPRTSRVTPEEPRGLERFRKVGQLVIGMKKEPPTTGERFRSIGKLVLGLRKSAYPVALPRPSQAYAVVESPAKLPRPSQAYAVESPAKK